MEVAFMSPGALTDAGGFIIYIGSDGKVHIKRVPPWDPGVRAELQTVFAVLEHAGAIKNAAVQKQFTAAATHVVEAHAAELQKAVG